MSRKIFVKIKKIFKNSRLPEKIKKSSILVFFNKLSSEKKSKILKLTALAVFFVIAWYVSGIWVEKNQKTKIEKLPEIKKEKINLGETGLLEQTWIEKASREVEKNKQEIKKTRNEVVKISKQIQDIKKMFAEIMQEMKKGKSFYYSAPASQKISETPGKKEVTQKIIKQKQEKPMEIVIPEKVKIQQMYKTAEQSLVKQYLPQPRKITPLEKNSNNFFSKQPPKSTAYQMQDLIYAQYDRKIVNKTEKREEVSKLKVGFYIPAGSFVNVKVLSGLYAPTGMKAKTVPQPVLLITTDKSFLPNNFRVNIRHCVIIGEGYGELASERVYIKVNKLTCVKNNGEIIQTGIQGYVVDTDGKIGMRGKVISRQGLFLARSLTASFINGIATAFKTSFYTTTTTALGTTITENPSGSDVFKVAIGEGVAKGFERLAKMYEELAKETFPVIEVPSGRNATVVFLSNVNLKSKEKLFLLNNNSSSENTGGNG